MNSNQALALELAQRCLERLQTDGHYNYLGHLSDTLPKHLRWMCGQIIVNAEAWPATKSHRWLGYIQGCMVCHGLTTVDAERDVVANAKHIHKEY